MVVDEGDHIGSIRYGYTMEACQFKCNEMDGCRNFRYCTEQMECHLKTKMISESSPEHTETSWTSSKTCFTIYQDCQNGMYKNRLYGY